MDENNIPADGADAEEAAKKALWRKAVGYEVEETCNIETDKGYSHIVKTKHVPGDLKALQLYRQLYGNGGI